LAINFEQHKTVLISFTGEGYDPSQLQEHNDQPDSSLAASNDSTSNDIIITSSSDLLTSGQVSCHGDIMFFEAFFTIGCKDFT